MSEEFTEHLHALQDRYDAAAADLAVAADAARAALDGRSAALRDLAGPDARPALIADVPVDELPPYVPPAPSTAANALVPDTPLIHDSSLASSALAFDDAPLWQS